MNNRIINLRKEADNQSKDIDRLKRSINGNSKRKRNNVDDDINALEVMIMVMCHPYVLISLFFFTVMFLIR